LEEKIVAEKKKFVMNCDVCDTRKIKEEDYSNYEQIIINADIVIVNERSKNIINRLPLILNHDRMLEIEDEIDIAVRVINGSYVITGKTNVTNHTILVVNGDLKMELGAAEVVKNYEHIVVNGRVQYPKSLEKSLGNLTVNGTVFAYPDEYMLLSPVFTMNQYFPLRAKEGGRYYVKDLVIVKDVKVELEKLVEKNVKFYTEKVLLLESKLEDCMKLFDENVEFMVVPNGMNLVYREDSLKRGLAQQVVGRILAQERCILNKQLIQKMGRKLFVYGDLEIDEREDMDKLCNLIDFLIVKGTVIVRENQQEAFYKMNAEYDAIEVIQNKRNLRNLLRVKIDQALLDHSPNGIYVCNIVKVELDEELSSEMILDKLMIENCSRVICNEKQESAVAAVSKKILKIGKDSDKKGMKGLKDLQNIKVVTADEYTM
jgi:glutaredoxin-related protein